MTDNDLNLHGKAGQNELTECRKNFTYRPPAAVLLKLPAGFEIPLTCVTSSSGTRRWFHAGFLTGKAVPGSVIPYCALGGMALFEHEGRLAGENLFSYRAMLLLFNFRRSFQEHVDRRFTGWKDLNIPASAQIDPNDPSVLSVVDPRLTYKELIKKGRAAAQRRGPRGASNERIIALGLHEIAKATPLELMPDQVPRLIRAALFAVDLDDAQIEQALDHPLVPRLLESIENHENDDQGEFNTWFSDQISHGFRSLARQKKADGGPLDPSEAKSLVLALLWRAYQYVGDCVDHYMRTVRAAFNPPLSADESTLYARMHLKQPVFGNLPWLLLAERATFLRPALEPWFDDPSFDEDKIIHRMLSMYAAMVSERRRADRHRKAEATRKTFELCDDSDVRDLCPPASPVENRDEVTRISQVVAERYDVACKCGSGALENLPADVDGDHVTFAWRCGACGRTKRHKCTTAEVREALAESNRGDLRSV